MFDKRSDKKNKQKLAKMTLCTAELSKLLGLFKQSEERLIDIMGLKRLGHQIIYSENVDLEEVRRTLQMVIAAAWEYVPQMITKQYMIGKQRGLKVNQSSVLSVTEQNVINKLSQDLIGTITEASITANNTIIDNWKRAQSLARLSSLNTKSIVSNALIESLEQKEAAGAGTEYAKAIFIEKIQEQGITAFTDRAGRNWTLSGYAGMATRTASRQATNLGILFADEEHDLYEISSHSSPCPICAPLEGRVYSRSGTSEFYPSLAAAFGKMDPDGGDGLDNTYLNIHPNCLHVLVKFTEKGRTDEEIQKIREFSSFETNPPNVDPRSEEQISAYRRKEQGRAKLLNDIAQYKKYRFVLGDDVPKTFQTFVKHKMSESEKYRQWKAAYRRVNRKLRRQTEQGITITINNKEVDVM